MLTPDASGDRGLWQRSKMEISVEAEELQQVRRMTATTLDDSNGAGRQQSWTAATMFDADDTKQQRRGTTTTATATTGNGNIDSSNLLTKHYK